MTNEQVIEKVRKLMALSKSDNQHEANAAAAKAEQLLQEYRLSEAEIEPIEVIEQASEGEPLDAMKQLPLWKSILANGLCGLHGCKPWVDRTGKTIRNRIRVVGRPSDIASVRYLYAWLTSTIDRLALHAGSGKGRSWSNAFRVGCVTGVLAAMKIANTEARAQVTSTALVKIDRRAVDAEREMRRITSGLRMMNRSSGRRYHGDAYRAGETAGRNIHTGANLPSGTGPRLLGGGK